LLIETTIALALVFGALVVFHELGHFISAKLVGIRVEEFAVGFGPKLLRLFRRGDTEYTIHPVPLGGFVKLAGMEPGEEDIADGFQAQPVWKRALVIFSGPFASFVLAMLVFVGLGVFWGFQDYSRPQNRVGMVQPKTEAARIGLRAGDRVLYINGRKIDNGREMTQVIHANPGKRLELRIARNGKKISLVAYPRWEVRYMGVTWSFQRGNEPLADGVYDPKLAAKAGIKDGDRLVAINDERILGGAKMTRAIESGAGKAAELRIQRGRNTLTRSVTVPVNWMDAAGARWIFAEGRAFADEDPNRPGRLGGDPSLKTSDQLVSINGKSVASARQFQGALARSRGKDLRLVVRRFGEQGSLQVRVPASAARVVDIGYHDSRGLLGFVTEPSLKKVGLAASVKQGLAETWLRASALIDTLFSEKVGEDVGGPVMIAKMTQSSVALGPYWVLMMMGMLSLSLAVINLLPIPILDGGHLAILALEAVRRRRLTLQQMQAVNTVGLAIVGTIIIAVLLSDITRVAGGMAPQ